MADGGYVVNADSDGYTIHVGQARQVVGPGRVAEFCGRHHSELARLECPRQSGPLDPNTVTALQQLSPSDFQQQLRDAGR